LARKKKTAQKKQALFSDFDLSSEMLKSLKQAGYEEPSPIQAGLIPLALDELDVLGQAQTGTGKTAAFAIPILELLEPSKSGDPPQALCLVPTRELAVQVREEFLKLCSGYGDSVHSVAVYGGKPIRGQIEKLKRGVEVVVGTPGRVIDLINRGALKLNNLYTVVLDEADRMLDIGFRPDIERILKQCPKDRQTLLLSATVPPSIEKLAKRYMQDPTTLNFSPTDITVDTIDQHYFTVDQERKFDLLVELLKREKPTQAIVFCRTKRRVDRIHRRLARMEKDCSCIHGDLTQGARDSVMAKFRKKGVRVLVATDVVGRGIDVSGVSHIINYDIPEFSDDYVHRVGRTGRMGREGVAFTFATSEEGGELTRIEQRINRVLKRDEIPGFQAFATPDNADSEEKEARPPSPFGRRPHKRYRRGV